MSASNTIKMKHPHSFTSKSTNEFLKVIEENDVQYLDLNFTDMRGKWQRTSQHVDSINKDIIEGGIYFDGSSIAGWKAINESDMRLLPDVGKWCMDPFAAQPTMKVFCDVIEPATDKPYNRDPRSIAKAAEKYKVGFSIDSEEGPYNASRDYESGNMGHRPRIKGGYFPEAPVDGLGAVRTEMLSVMKSMGVPVEKHHHEVAPSQCELGIKYSGLTDAADNIQLYKHVVHNVAHAYGKTATFMPKPVFGDNGSGMHVHQSLYKAGKPLFAGDEYSGLSEMALYYIGGIIRHARALNAFTNPSTNSYKRLVPGYEAPVLLAYSARNRSASCRIPFATSPHGKRLEVRFPDPMCNPYLGNAAMMMAGLDGIENKIHPGDAMDQNLYELPAEELAKVPTVCGSLREALECLATDHAFLLKGNVFTADMLESYIDMKMEEVEAFETMPHPIEFQLYYSS